MTGIRNLWVGNFLIANNFCLQESLEGNAFSMEFGEGPMLFLQSYLSVGLDTKIVYQKL